MLCPPFSLHLFILEGKEDIHQSLDEFDFPPNQTIYNDISCFNVWKKIIVFTFSWFLFNLSFLNLQIKIKCMIFRMSWMNPVTLVLKVMEIISSNFHLRIQRGIWGLDNPSISQGTGFEMVKLCRTLPGAGFAMAKLCWTQHPPWENVWIRAWFLSDAITDYWVSCPWASGKIKLKCCGHSSTFSLVWIFIILVLIVRLI